MDLLRSCHNWNKLQIILDHFTSSIRNFIKYQTFFLGHKDQLYKMLEYDSWIKFPEDSEILEQVLLTMQEKRKVKDILKNFKSGKTN